MHDDPCQILVALAGVVSFAGLLWWSARRPCWACRDLDAGYYTGHSYKGKTTKRRRRPPPKPPRPPVSGS